MTATMECYRVMRDCHTSGGVCDLCADRIGVRVRRVQMDKLSKEKAEEIARNWREYNGTVELMEEKKDEQPEVEPLAKVTEACKAVHERVLDPENDTPYILKKTTLPGGKASFRFVTEIELDGETFEVQVRRVK